MGLLVCFVLCWFAFCADLLCCFAVFVVAFVWWLLFVCVWLCFELMGSLTCLFGVIGIYVLLWLFVVLWFVILVVAGCIWLAVILCLWIMCFVAVYLVGLLVLVVCVLLITCLWFFRVFM